MADVLPQNFPIPAENLTASFDYFEYASGTGYKNFYCLVTDDSSTTTYALTTQTLESTYNKRKFFNTVASTYVTNNFDITFNTPALISGTALIAYLLEAAPAGASTGNAQFTFYHVRGVTTTQIGTVTGASTTLGGASQIHRLSTQCSLTATAFAPGDTLRVAVGVRNTANNFMGIWCDPASISTLGESDTASNPTVTTDLTIRMPFKIQQ